MWKVLIQHYFHKIYAMNDIEGLVEDLWELKYTICNPRLVLISRVWSWDVTVSEVKEKQDQDPISLVLKESVHNQWVLAFEQGGDGVLKYQGRLCVPKVDGLQETILEEAHSSRYSIHLSSITMYHDLKRDIAEFVSKC